MCTEADVSDVSRTGPAEVQVPSCARPRWGAHDLGEEIGGSSLRVTWGAAAMRDAGAGM